MPRIVIIGTSCAGKSTLARELAGRLTIPHIELDALHWEQDWTPAPREIFRDRVKRAVAAENWVLDGNYNVVRDLIWHRADALIWLDYSLPVLLTRAVIRTTQRCLFRQTCCNGNHESIRRAFSRDSILLWVVTTFRRRRQEFNAILPELSAQGHEIITLHSPAATKRWLSRINSDTFRIRSH